MSRPEVERQLLLALLAFQNGFLDRTALLTAFDAWSQSKARPLGELLVAQGAITSDKRQLLESLVDHFLQRFDGDTAKSLAHVSSLEASVRDELQQRAAPDVQASLAGVGRAAAPPETIVREVGEATSAGTRFRILRPHARGGLGEVFVADDGELHREVALKQIQARHADDPSSRERFLLEAEITGGLEHPSIVPVYGLGTYADGRPFYAMRFIRGDSLQEAAARFHDPSRKLDAASRSLEFRKLLQRFIDVCNAVDYAHSRGVLHRDLKPGNIMLGTYGETLVVDWGLAKVVGRGEQASANAAGERTLHPSGLSGSSPTLHGSAIGTPGYMSPEQAAGKIDELNSAVDVYSLGATLFHLLTGRAPFVGDDLGEVLRNIQRGEFAPPQRLRPDVPKPLEAICLRAMALLPHDRYVSARTLADDIEHWLADEPVTAGRETPFDRLRRWSRKHRAVVGSAAAALILVAGVSVLAAVSINRSRQNEQTAREQAEANAGEAELQRDLALDTLGDLIFDVQDQLANRPGLSDLKKRILDTAAQNLTKISAPLAGNAEARGDGKVDYLSAAAMLKTGDILVRLGSTAEAADLYRRAQKVLAQRVEAEPNNPSARRELSISYNKLAEVVAQQGDFAEARRLYEQSLEIRRKLAEAAPADLGVQRDLSIVYEGLALVVAKQGDLDAARSLHEQSLAIGRNLAAAEPANLAAQRDLSVSLNHAGNIAAEQGNWTAARSYYEQDLEIARRLAEADPKNTEAQRDLSVTYNRLGETAIEQSDLAAARAFYEQGLEIRNALAEADADDAQAQRDLWVSYSKLGSLTALAGDAPAAREFFERALAILRRTAEADRDDAQAQRDLMVVEYQLGGVLQGERNFAAAAEAYRRGAATLQGMIEKGMLVERARQELTVLNNLIAECEAAQSRPRTPTRAEPE